MYPWLKMLLHCKNKITDIFPYFFKENTVKYFNTFQKKETRKLKKLRILFSTRTVYYFLDEMLRSNWSSVVEAPKQQSTRCVWKSAGSLRRRARFFNPVPGSKSADIIYVLLLQFLLRRRSAAISTTTTSPNSNEAQWSEKTRQKNCMSFKVFRTMVFVASLDSQDYRLTGQWALALGFK